MVLVMSPSLRTLIGSAIRESWPLAPEPCGSGEGYPSGNAPYGRNALMWGAKKRLWPIDHRRTTISYREAELLSGRSLQRHAPIAAPCNESSPP